MRISELSAFDLETWRARSRASIPIAPDHLRYESVSAAFDAQAELDAKVALYRRNRDLLIRRLPEAGIDRFLPPGRSSARRACAGGRNDAGAASDEAGPRPASWRAYCFSVSLTTCPEHCAQMNSLPSAVPRAVNSTFGMGRHSNVFEEPCFW